MIEVNYNPGNPETWEKAKVLVLYPGEVAEARAKARLPELPWLAGSKTDNGIEPKVLSAMIEGQDLVVNLAHPQFDPNVDEPPIRVTGLRIYDDPTYRPPRDRG